MIHTSRIATSALCAGVAVGSLLTFASLATAGQTTYSDSKSMGKPMVEMDPVEPKSRWSGDLGVTVVSQYISRGLIFENDGAIVQPYADLYLNLYEGEGFLTSVTLNLGIWSSLHSRHTDAGAVSGGNSSLPAWYEFDYTVGVSFGFAKYFSITPSYFEFVSPNDGFDPVRALNIKLAFDDSEFWGGKFALNPYFTYYREFEGKAGNGSDQGSYYELGLSPGFELGPVGISLPVAVGLGSDEFYADDETFGFASAGLAASYGLTFIPKEFGEYTLTAGATYYYLGDALNDFNNPNVRDENEHEYVFSGGIGVAF